MGAEDGEIWRGRVSVCATWQLWCWAAVRGGNGGGSCRCSHPCPTSPPQTARVGIAHAERAQDVGSFVAEDFATSMLHSWSFKTDKPGGSK
jgi:hypothetical protein